jgi:translation elongation factor EF-G
MEEKQLEEIIIKSVFWARFANEGSAQPTFMQYVNGTGRKLKENADEKLKSKTEGKWYNLWRVIYSPINQTVKKYYKAIREKEEEPASTFQKTIKAQDFLNTLAGYYKEPDKNESLLECVKDYILDEYCIKFEEAHSHNLREVKGIKRTRNCFAAGTALAGITLAVVSSPATLILMLGAGVLGGTIGAGYLQYSLMESKSRLKKAKKDFKADEELNHGVAALTRDNFNAVLIKEDNAKRIKYLIECPAADIQEAFNMHKKDNSTL